MGRKMRINVINNCKGNDVFRRNLHIVFIKPVLVHINPLYVRRNCNSITIYIGNDVR